MGKLFFLFVLIFVGYSIYYIIQLLIANRQKESFIADSQGRPMMFMDESLSSTFYKRDPHHFLLASSDSDINNLKEMNPYWINQMYIDKNAIKENEPNPSVVKQRMSRLKVSKIKDQFKK